MMGHDKTFGISITITRNMCNVNTRNKLHTVNSTYMSQDHHDGDYCLGDAFRIKLSARCR